MTTSDGAGMANDRWFSIDSPWVGGAGGPGAPVRGSSIAIIRVNAPSDALDDIIAGLGWKPVESGGIGVRAMPTGDEVLLTRASPGAAFLMPLGSGLLVGSITRALESLGCDRRPESDPRERFPEARTLVEACALDALGHAPSPLAIDVILRQRERWDRVPPPPLAVSPNPLDNLLAPPRVVVVGRPNIGKSSVLNAMARRPIAIASDEPGTTRDHVGAEVECDGLIVRWIDTPGIPAPGSGRVADIDRIALERGPALVATADLLVLAADGSSGPIDPAELPARNPRMPLIRIALRADLGAPPGGSDVITSARTGQGLAELARVIRRSLVPDAALAEPARWRFHPFLPGG